MRPFLHIIFLLSLLWKEPSCYAYDITQPPKQTPPPLPAKQKQKKANATVILSSMCSGAVGAIIGSALAPQNLARQWVAVSTAGTVLLISAGVEGEWVGRLKDWWKHRRATAPKPQRQKVEEVLEYSSESSSGNDSKFSQVSEVEIDYMGQQVKPVRKETSIPPTKRDPQGSSETTSSDGDASTSSFSSEESSSAPHQIKVSDQTPKTKDLGKKKSHRNLLMFWKRKKSHKEDTDDKPSIPAWSEFASKDTSRGYEEDYGDDDIGEGLGL